MTGAAADFRYHTDTRAKREAHLLRIYYGKYDGDGAHGTGPAPRNTRAMQVSHLVKRRRHRIIDRDMAMHLLCIGIVHDELRTNALCGSGTRVLGLRRRGNALLDSDVDARRLGRHTIRHRIPGTFFGILKIH